MSNEGIKEVFFGEYCPKCVNKDVAEADEPCFECLAEPGRVESHRPVRYEQKVSAGLRDNEN